MNQCEGYLLSNFSQAELEDIISNSSPALWGILQQYENTGYYDKHLAVFQTYLPHLPWTSSKDAKRAHRAATKALSN